MAVGEEGNARPGNAQPPKTVGRYTLYDRIAAGGMGQVHFGRLHGVSGFSRTVAIKRLHAHLASEPEFAAMFLDEARLAARIHHPNVVGTLDALSEDGELFLVMDYVPGESLAKLLLTLSRDGARMPAGHAVAILVGALHGLHAAHEARNPAGESLALVHRDVSPQNILVGEDGVARVIDFGVAKAAERVHVTQGHQVRGKLAYMAPEQLAGGRLDRRADIFAASTVLWEMLVGRRLAGGDTNDSPAIVMAARASEPERPSERNPEVPRGLDDIVLCGLARDPDKRFATALEMATALERVLVPSSQGDVGAWVVAEAGESLAERRRTLKRIETESESTPDRQRGARPAPGRGSFPPTVAPPSGENAADTRTVATRSYGRRPIAISVVVAAVALAWVGGTVYGRMQRAGPVGAAGSPLIAAGDSASGATPSASMVAVANVTPPTTPALASVESAPASADSSSAAAAPASTTSRAPRPKRPSCNPPYRIEHGIKVAKVECL